MDWEERVRNHGKHGAKRRFKSGQWVQFEGLYMDDWGGDLLLLQGDLFPAHPQMGDTAWTYMGPSAILQPKSPKLNGHFVGF
ncbi:hypothetical protein RB620_17290 [Paenibacillus sp. LHD-117]|uniref:hypothetical protein n=1 Tax=Paenibacillus sp. LHD-117 TaxID=3071412 RepID=UPI0027E03D45|nr:hypothetical protein [Paenibacillus sp. LHD-117]MDQ6421181.1 hypothetical protein [Paenibacillus sp. LHD-117]